MLCMTNHLPLLGQTPFKLDPKPLTEASSAHAGALATSRAFRSLGLPTIIDEKLSFYKRRRGFTEAQMIESIVLLQTIGGECPEDVGILAADACLQRGLGYRPPKVTAVREFLEHFHDSEIEASRPSREEQLSFILPESDGLKGLAGVLSASVAQIAAAYEKEGKAQTIATIDQDATIIESHKRAAYYHYKGGKGYQPMLAVWAEADVVIAQEFRDGNVPARQSPLTCCKRAMESLPSSVQERYFRGDSGCYEQELLRWLGAEERTSEPGGRIGFAISANMSPQLLDVARSVAEDEWTTFGTDPDGAKRQWAELDFVPSLHPESKRIRPLRYVGLRILKPQGTLFNDGGDRRYFAVVTNLDYDGAKLIEWHREKAGTIEHVHDELKNGLAGGHMPSQRFAVNAAWLTCSAIAYNIASAIKGLCLSPKERNARFKRYRLLLVSISGRMNRNNCVMGLRLCAGSEVIERMQRVWAVFDLPTRASAPQPFRASG